MSTYTGKLTSLQRLKSSSYGNPRFQFVVDGQIIQTSPNSMFGYSVQNFEDKQVIVETKILRGNVTLTDIKGA